MLTEKVDVKLDIKNKLHDYIFLCFMLGNDFVPKMPSLNIRTMGIINLLNAYKKLFSNSYLIKNNIINWYNVRKLLRFMSNREELWLQKEVDNLNKFKISDSINNPEIILKTKLNRKIENHINPYITNWQVRYYEELFDTNDKDDICKNYCESLEWTFKYYTEGCINNIWYYKYNYAPLLVDLANYINQSKNTYIPIENSNILNEKLLLCYVLPVSQLEKLLPKTIYNKLKKKIPYWYPENARFNWAFCKYFWESHPLLPKIDLDELKSMIEN